MSSSSLAGTGCVNTSVCFSFFLFLFFLNAIQDPSSPLLHSADAFQLYLGCLVNLGQDTAVNAAVEKRDSLIAAHPLPEAPSPQEDASTPQTEEPPSQEPQQTQSQILAKTVLAQGGAPPSTGTMSQADLSKLLAALTSGNGSPIQVSVIERTYIRILLHLSGDPD